MYALSEERFKKEALPYLNRLFAHLDAYNKPFASQVEERRLLYPVGFVLKRTNPQFLSGLVSTARKLGDEGFYLSYITKPQRFAPWEIKQDEPYNWYYPFADIDSFSVHMREQILYSPSGQWGLMISFEDHGLLGGSSAFFDIMKTILPGFDNMNQVREFLADWKYYKEEHGVDIRWVPDLLFHIYGAKVAQRLLEESGLSK